VLGYQPLILDLEAEHDTDHVIAVSRIAATGARSRKSNFNGLAFREPIHRTLRELVMSYFYAYFNLFAN